jgi:hypothetical protein
MANWNRIWERRKRQGNLNNTGVKAAVPGSGVDSAAFVKRTMKRRAKNKVAKQSRKVNR